MADTRKKLLDFIGISIAHSDMGIYPQKVSGGTKPYDQRSEWMEGWNAYGTALVKKWCKVSAWLRNLPRDLKERVEDLLIEERLYLSVSEDLVQPFINCNDLFYWGCADAEAITLEEIPDLLRALEESPTHGDALWACRKRQMRPQKPYYKSFSAEEVALFDAAGPEREE